MADIQFQEPQYGRSNLSGPRRSWLTNLVISTGLAGDERSAKYVLLVITGIAIALAVALPNLMSGPENPTVPQSAIDAAFETPRSSSRPYAR